MESMHRENEVGRWNDNKCDTVFAYICKKGKDPSIQPGGELNSNNGCPSGWLRVLASLIN